MMYPLIPLLLSTALLSGQPAAPAADTQPPAVTEPAPIPAPPALIADPTPEPNQPSADAPRQGLQETESWWFQRNRTHLPPAAQQDVDIRSRDGYYLGDMQHKVIYLTFDEGYENGCTAEILDILAENDVKAAFFVTTPYVKENPALVQRMVDEGHLVGNHTTTHPDCSRLSLSQLQKELGRCADAYRALTGQEMKKFFRPPEGKYSIASLTHAQTLGYKTIFWSFAYADWDPDKQPGRDRAYQMVVDNHHNGAIMLLHAVSRSNTDALGDSLKFLKEQGYVFLSLEDLP